MRRLRRLLCNVVTALTLTGAGLVVPAAAGAATPACQDYAVPVTVLTQQLSMHGSLCQPAGTTTDTVQVLVPGASYTSIYWNFRYQPDLYNFRLAMNRAGYATFTLDRLGTGQSSRPLSATVTASGQASAIHQVIQALRLGRLGGRSFHQVILGGHSLGSTITILEASTYHDEDGVLLTGITHHLNLPAATRLFVVSFRPAALDPRFAGGGYDPGYLTTAPGTRQQDFYSPGQPDPQVVALDEQTKDVFSTTEAPDAVASTLLPLTTSIQVPVLMVAGQHDGLVCGTVVPSNCATAATLAASEAGYFPPAAHLRTYVLAGFGHDVNLAPNTRDYQQAVIGWADASVGR